MTREGTRAEGPTLGSDSDAQTNNDCGAEQHKHEREWSPGLDGCVWCGDPRDKHIRVARLDGHGNPRTAWVCRRRSE